MKLNRNWVLSCGVAASAILLAQAAVASDFTIVNGQTVTTTQILNTTGDVGTVQAGGTINVAAGGGIDATVNGVTIINSGTASGSDLFPFLSSGIAALDYNAITNSGTAIGFFWYQYR